MRAVVDVRGHGVHAVAVRAEIAGFGHGLVDGADAGGERGASVDAGAPVGGGGLAEVVGAVVD